MRSLFGMAEPVGRLLRSRGETLAISESACGGLISAALLSVPGSSAYFLGGATVYTRTARRTLLRFDAEQALMRGADETYARLCADTVRRLMGADWAIGESGAAGPTGNRYGDPAGHVALAVSGPVSAARIVRTGTADREQNMWAFADAALALLLETIEG